MHDNYMENFFKKVNKSYVTRNTDSTDFEYPTKIPAVSTKNGKHHLLDGVNRNDNPRNIQTIYEDPKLRSKERDKNHFQHVLQKYWSKEKLVDTQNGKEERISDIRNNQKNQGDHQRWLNSSSKSVLQGKVLPRLSHIFKLSSYYTKQLPSIEENHKMDTNQLYCVGCERKRIKKRHKAHRRLEQPVYNVGGDLLNPFLPKASLPQKHMTKNQSSGTPSPLTSSVGSLENPYNRRSMTPDDGVENYEIFYNQTNLEGSDCKRHKTLQYPSMYSKQLTQAMRNTCCQANYGSIPANRSNYRKVKPSSSSSFWNFVAEKIQSKYKKNNQIPDDCACEDFQGAPQIINQKQDLSHCCPSSCDKFKNVFKGSSDTLQSPNRGRMSPDSLQTRGLASSGVKLTKAPVPPSLSKNATATHECQCSSKEMKTPEAGPRTYNECQKPHDEVTATLAENYNGEILCIHNPPCVLINGCLNLPPPKPSGLLNIWRFTQTKNSSEMRKHKLPTQFIEQACQYEPPFVIQDLLPEFQTEKIIQSACNHNPPCEVVRGCYKPKLDQCLKDSRSCVHVPMCPKLPECLLRYTAEGQTQCPHHPRCREFPVCSRKLLLLTAKEDMSTQVRPRSRMVCRHDPPCLMIPRCIGRVLCTDAVPYDAIPDCVHQPFCELIPACCRKTAKEMVSVSSQYPKTPCRIV